MKRIEILNIARGCVAGGREQDHGKPEDNFSIIANLWSAYLCIPISAVDVAMLMVMLKAARVKSGRYHEDNFVDIAGYAACAGEIACREPSLLKVSETVEANDPLDPGWYRD